MEHLTARLIGSAFRTARKAHTCQCGGPIKVGQRYERAFWIVEGDKVTEKVGDHIHSFEQDEDREAY